MYRELNMNVKTCGGPTKDFSITISLHQDLAVSVFTFVVVLDKITRSIQGDAPWSRVRVTRFQINSEQDTIHRVKV